MDNIIRCEWCLKDQLYRDYHDHEWGIPVHDDQQLLESLILGGAQAGLSWHMVLKKRENYRNALDYFDAEKIARYEADKIQSLLQDSGIIRNKLKIVSAIHNARAFLQVKEAYGSFDQYIWQFTDYKTVVNHPKDLKDLPAKTKESDAMSKDLLNRGFKFVGSTICYAFMQAVGMVDDHLENCWCKYRK